MPRKRGDSLERDAIAFARCLMFEGSGGRIGKERPMPEGSEKKEITSSLDSRRALLDSVVKLIEKLHKMAPEDPEEPDGINTYKEMLNGSVSRESGDRGVTTPAALSDAPEQSSDDE